MQSLSSLISSNIVETSHLTKRQKTNHLHNDKKGNIQNITKVLIENIFNFLTFKNLSQIAPSFKLFNEVATQFRESQFWKEQPTKVSFKHYVKWHNSKHADNPISEVGVLFKKIHLLRELEINSKNVLIAALNSVAALPQLRSLSLGSTLRLRLKNFDGEGDIERSNENVFELISKKCPNLRTFTLLTNNDEKYYELHCQNMNSIFENCKELTSFIYEAFGDKSCENLQKLVSSTSVPLTHFFIGEDMEISAETFESILKHSPQLKEIYFDNIINFDPLVLISEHCKTLDAITLNNPPSFISLREFTLKFKGLTRLQGLNFLEWFSESNQTLEHCNDWYLNCQNLKILECCYDTLGFTLEDYVVYDETYISTMLSHMPNLESLKIPIGIKSHDFPEERPIILDQNVILKAIGAFNHNLKHLNLYLIQKNYDDSGLIALAEGCPQLETIALRTDNGELTPNTRTGMEAILKKCTHLKSLQF